MQLIEQATSGSSFADGMGGDIYWEPALFKTLY